jgi:RND superfamily putative drug exporter
VLESWSWFLVRRRRLVLAGALLAFLAALPLVVRVNDHLTFDAFTDTGSEAFQGERILEEEFDAGAPNLVLLVTARSGSVDAPERVAGGTALTNDVSAMPGIEGVVSYWSSGRSPELRSHHGDRALVLGRIRGDDSTVDRWIQDFGPELERHRPGIAIRLGGSAQTFRQASEVSTADFERAELVTIPLILVALLVVFGSLVAAFLPLLVALIAVVGTALVLIAMTQLTDVSNFALTLTTALGLGLGVDYSLFVVNRFREELAAGTGSDVAVVRTVQTAGRTVLFSALAVLVALGGLLIVPLDFMRSIGFAAMATAAMAAVGSLLVLPAVLAILGERVNRGMVWRRAIEPRGFWYRAAIRVMRRPLAVSGALVALLLLMASPALGLNVGLPDERTFSEGTAIRDTAEILRSEFDTRSATPLFVVLPTVDAERRAKELDSYASRLAALPGVESVLAASGEYRHPGRSDVPAEVARRLMSESSTYLTVANSADPISAESEQLVRGIRELPSPFARVLVTGEAVNAYDVKEKIVGAIPLALGFIAAATFVVLFLQFGSLLVPLKAIALNALTIAALLGALVWVFQDGHFQTLLDFTASGSIYVNVPIIIFALAFGLSMDYEVFLLSRIKEEYTRTGDNETSIAIGLDRCGRIVSAAAILIALVFVTTGVFSSMRMMKSFGLGLAGVVLLDAFVIRGTLVPALMKLAGPWNWWAPGPLRRLHDRFGLDETIDPGDR